MKGVGAEVPLRLPQRIKFIKWCPSRFFLPATNIFPPNPLELVNFQCNIKRRFKKSIGKVLCMQVNIIGICQ